MNTIMLMGIKGRQVVGAAEDRQIKIDSQSYVHNGMVMQWGRVIAPISGSESTLISEENPRNAM
jgi:hypothetical protein